MAIRVAAHRYGEEAFGALRAAVAAAKGGGPLAPVTVVVERGALGLATRRRLAAQPPGIASVRFLRWGDLAAELAARGAPGAPRQLATRAVELEALRAVLATGAPARLSGARDQPGTLRALARTYRELAPLPSGVLDALAGQGERAADVVGVVRAARARLEGWDDEAARFDAAAAAVRRDPRGAAAGLGALVAYLPTRAGPGAEGLLEALGGALHVDVVVGTTGDRASDEMAHRLVARLGPRPAGPDRGAAAAPARGAFEGDLRVCAAPTADAEVLLALRHLMRRNEQGVPLGRLAILHGGAPPYPQLVHDALRVAGIPSYGHGTSRLAATVAGRVLLGALSLGERDWRREEVSAWLASGPVLHRGRPVPAAAWSALAREAGVVAGLEDWRRRLPALAASRREAAARLAAGLDGGDADARDDGSGGPDALRRDAGRCEALVELISVLAARFEALPADWRGWADWARRLLDGALGGPLRRADWPHEEVVAFEAVADALASMAVLDRVAGPPPGLADFRAALAAALDGPAPQTARAGSGVLAARVADAVGIDLDTVCVVGMVDGAFPARVADDVLLPDPERARADPAVPLRAAGRSEGRRDFLAALAGTREAVLFYARGDQRTGRPLRPARLVLEVLEHLAADGRHLVPGDVQDGPPDGAPAALRDRFDFAASYAGAVLGHGPLGGDPLSAADWELRSLLRWRRQRGTLDGHFCLGRDRDHADRVLERAVGVRAARRSAAFTRFDGLLRGVAVPSPAGGAVVSATGLEAYARCPRSYLFARLLDVAVRESPEALVELSPLERGHLAHEVLERLVGEELPGAHATGPGEPAAREQRMLELVSEGIVALERRGVVLHPVLAELERARLEGDLRRFLRADAAYRARTGASPLVVEARFGWEGQDDVAVPVPGTPAASLRSRTVRFRGRIDRIDRIDLVGGAEDGEGRGRSSLGVIDYKTGAARTPTGRDPDDPVERGTRLQLPVYALGAQSLADASGWGAPPGAAAGAGTGAVVTRAGYWFVGARPAPEWVEVDASLRDRFESVVATMVEGIEAGVFPANPGGAPGDARPRDHCRTCPFDAMCPPRRGEQWGAKRADERLAAYRVLAEPQAAP